MHLVYIDDSKDEHLECFSAISIPEDNWSACLTHLIGVRQQLRDSDGLFTRKELHATDFVGGRGRIAHTVIPKARRAALFDFILTTTAFMPGAQLFNAAAPRGDGDRVFEWLLNRIEVNMKKSGSRAVIFCDEGKSYDSILRRMRRFNYIPSKYGAWPGHGGTKNIVAQRLIEDLSYRKSHRSLFIQLADFCAFALLRRERPIPSRSKYGLDRSFYLSEPIMVKAANGKDQYGVIR